MRLLAVAVLASALSTPATHADVRGRVVGPDGAPIRDARVRAFHLETPDERFTRFLSPEPDRTPLATTQSAPDGTFEIATGEHATVQIVADMKGRTVAISEAIDGEPLDPIVLHERAENSGRVTFGGKGVSGARVFYARGALSVRTDEAGRYSIPMEASPQEPPSVVHPDFAVATARPRPDYSLDLDVSLTRGVPISGRVVGANDDQPVANAIIRVDGWPLGKSAEDGTFTIQHAPPAWRSIEAEEGSRAGISTRAGRTVQVIKLGPAVSISGVVRDARSDKPLPGAIVGIGSMYGLSRGARSDAKGRYLISGLPAGTYRLFTSRTGYNPMGVRDELRAAAGDRLERAFALTPLTRLGGLVLDEDRKPVSGAEVSLSRFGLRTVTSTDGRFRLLVPSSASGMLTAHKAGYAIATAGPYNVANPQDDVAITLRRGFPLQIRVVDKDRKPVAAASISISAAPDDEFTRIPELVVCDERTIVITCRTNAGGMFETRVTEGTYELGADGAGFVRKRLAPLKITAATAPVVIEVQRAVTISGRVVNDDGGALSIGPVQVIARDGPEDRRTPPTATTTTAEDGSFVLTGLPAGNLTLHAQVAGNPPASGPESEVAAPATDVELVAPRLITVSGQVVERATGQPVREFRALLLRRTARGASGGGHATFQDAEGRFTLERVSPSPNLELMIDAPGYARSTVTLDTANTQPLDVKLDRAAILRVKVTSGGGPVAEANVNAMSTGRDAFGFGRGVSMTDEEGLITLDTLAPGDYTVNVQKKGFVTTRKTVELSSTKETSIEVELAKGREIRGVVVDEEGKPIGRARVHAMRPGAGYPGTQTDGDGSFVLEGLGEGAHTITAEKQGYVSARKEDVDQASAMRLTLTLKSGGTISGRVVGLPAEEMPAVRVVASGPGSRATARPDENGNFEVKGVPDGRVQVSATIENRPGRQSTPRLVEVISGAAAPVEVDFREGIIVSGRVTRAGAPVTEASVRFMPRERPQGGFTPPEALTTSTGSYVATIPNPGEYAVSVSTSRGSHFEAGSVTITASTTHDIDMRGSTVRGRVIDAETGAAVPGANVFVVREQPRNPMGSPPVTTDADGRFLFDPVSAGTYALRVQKSRYVPLNRTLEVVDDGANDVEIRLERGETVAVRVLDAATGKPVDGASINVRDSANKPAFGGAPPRDDNGVITIQLSAGQYRVLVSAPQYPSQSASLSVPGPELVVRLMRGGRLAIEGRVEGASSLRVVSAAGPSNLRGPAPPFRFENIAPGAYRLEILGSNGTVLVTRTITITSDATTTVSVP